MVILSSYQYVNSCMLHARNSQALNRDSFAVIKMRYLNPTGSNPDTICEAFTYRTYQPTLAAFFDELCTYANFKDAKQSRLNNRKKF